MAIAASIGFGGLYFHNPTEFWTTMDQVEAYMKPLGKCTMSYYEGKKSILAGQCLSQRLKSTFFGNFSKKR